MWESKCTIINYVLFWNKKVCILKLRNLSPFAKRCWQVRNNTILEDINMELGMSK